jgi:hypothetical protein
MKILDYKGKLPNKYNVPIVDRSFDHKVRTLSFFSAAAFLLQIQVSNF